MLACFQGQLAFFIKEHSMFGFCSKLKFFESYCFQTQSVFFYSMHIHKKRLDKQNKSYKELSI